LEVVEMTCGTASMMMGETVEGLADGEGGREGEREGEREGYLRCSPV